MIEIFGRQVPVTLAELIEPRHTALVLVDVQNDFCLPEGKQFAHPMVARQGGTGGYAPVLERLRSVVPAARAAGVQIIYTQQTTLPDHKSDSAAYIRYRLRRFLTEDTTRIPELVDFCLLGTWGHEIVDVVRPAPNDAIVMKHRSDAFVGTSLDALLKNNGIRTVVLCGAQTDGCCMSTARGANHHDYFVVILEDCVNSFNRENHEAALKVMRTRFDVVASAEVLSTWRSAAAARAVAARAR
jgi:nicotinamidase-related amidase